LPDWRQGLLTSHPADGAIVSPDQPALPLQLVGIFAHAIYRPFSGGA
jgi:hypothetical protein